MRTVDPNSVQGTLQLPSETTMHRIIVRKVNVNSAHFGVRVRGAVDRSNSLV